MNFQEFWKKAARELGTALRNTAAQARSPGKTKHAGRLEAEAKKKAIALNALEILKSVEKNALSPSRVPSTLALEKRGDPSLSR